MIGWWSRYGQRQSDLAASVDGDLVQANKLRFKLSYFLIGTAAGLAVTSLALYLRGWIANVCFGVSILLGVSGLVSFKWAQAESSFLHRPDPEKPPRIIK